MRNNKGQFLKGNISPNKKEHILKYCKLCNKDFKVKVYRKNTAKYCSRLCQNRVIRKYRKYNKHSDEIRKKISIRTKEKTPRGLKCHSWKGGITPITEKLRKSSRYKNWRTAVFNRDNFTCQICEEVGGELNAHHIKYWSKYPELRFIISNGITLCKLCHQKIHQN